ncbi:DMT family transporter [Marinicellulosiphila megalodicopiae]|uniref:DMT family transporter n=1 Tax=Marinicellulosiphila megalodicopiae TaxID=2724896 RepID=UPI003BAFDAD9
MKTLLWMSASLISFCLMAVAARELSGQLAIVQTLAIRSFVGIIILTSILIVTKQLSSLKTKKLSKHALRNLTHLVGQYGWFVGIGLLPLSNVFALEFTVPVWVALIAAIFLKEKITQRKIIAIILGVLGVLIILRPGIQIVDHISLIVLVSAMFYAVAHSTTKSLTSTDSPIVIIFYMCLMQFPIVFSFALFDWQWPNPTQWSWLALISITGLTAHFCMTKAMQLSQVTTVMTLDFLRLPMITVVGILFYAEGFELWLLLGAGLMLLGNWIALYKKR